MKLTQCVLALFRKQENVVGNCRTIPFRYYYGLAPGSRYIVFSNVGLSMPHLCELRVGALPGG